MADAVSPAHRIRRPRTVSLRATTSVEVERAGTIEEATPRNGGDQGCAAAHDIATTAPSPPQMLCLCHSTLQRSPIVIGCSAQFLHSPRSRQQVLSTFVDILQAILAPCMRAIATHHILAVATARSGAHLMAFGPNNTRSKHRGRRRKRLRLQVRSCRLRHGAGQTRACLAESGADACIVDC